jgi:hypothetical protein
LQDKVPRLWEAVYGSGRFNHPAHKRARRPSSASRRPSPSVFLGRRSSVFRAKVPALSRGQPIPAHAAGRRRQLGPAALAGRSWRANWAGFVPDVLTGMLASVQGFSELPGRFGGWRASLPACRERDALCLPRTRGDRCGRATGEAGSPNGTSNGRSSFSEQIQRIGQPLRPAEVITRDCS